MWLTIFRPLINRKLEEKDCGEGPNLENIFEDDIHMNEIQENIIVRKIFHVTVHAKLDQFFQFIMKWTCMI